MSGPIVRTKRLKILEPLQDANSDEILVRNSETKEVSSLPKESVFASDNIKIEIAIDAPVDPTAESFADAINALPLFTIDGKTIPTFKAVTTGENPAVYYVELLNLGKGSYGVTGTQLTASNIKVTVVTATATDIAELSSTQIIDLGNQGDDVVTAMNRQMPNIIIQDQNDGYAIIKGIFLNGQFHEYLWIGTAGTYGRDVLQTTDQDFKELSSVSQGVARATDSYSGTVKTDVYKENPTVYVKETVDELLKGKANFFLAIKTITGISYNVIIDDILNELVYEGTLPMNVIIPNNATVPFPIGTIFYTLGTNTGILSASGGTGVVLKLKSGISLSALQNEVRQYTKTGINTWNVRGDLNLGAVTQTELSYLQGVTSNIQAQINAKTTLNGTPNYLMKFLTASTATISRLFEYGTFLGIGTANLPTKDLTLGNQVDREVGIEQSDNVTKGRNLKIRAGRTINFIPSAGFLPLNQGVLNATAIVVFPNKDVLVAMGNTDTFFLQTAGIGNFVSIGSGFNCSNMASDGAGNSYMTYSGQVYKRLAGTSYNPISWVSLGLPNRNYTGVACAPNGDIYLCVAGGDIYKQTGGVGAFNALGQTSRQWSDIVVAPNGDVFAAGLPEDVYKQTGGVGNFIGQGTFINCYALTFTATGDLYLASNGRVMKAVAGVFPMVQVDSRTFIGLASNSEGSVYAINQGSDIYYQSNNNLGAENLDGGAFQAVAGTGKGNGKSRFEIWTGQKLPSGTDMQTETLREYIDENGHHIYTSMPVFADNAAAIAGGLPEGCEYRTATGVKMIVY